MLSWQCWCKFQQNLCKSRCALLWNWHNWFHCYRSHLRYIFFSLYSTSIYSIALWVEKKNQLPFQYRIRNLSLTKTIVRFPFDSIKYSHFLIDQFHSVDRFSKWLFWLISKRIDFGIDFNKEKIYNRSAVKTEYGYRANRVVNDILYQCRWRYTVITEFNTWNRNWDEITAIDQ